MTLPTSDHSCRNPGGTAYVEQRCGGVDPHGIEVLPQHLLEEGVLAPYFEPGDVDPEQAIIELVGLAPLR